MREGGQRRERGEGEGEERKRVEKEKEGECREEKHNVTAKIYHKCNCKLMTDMILSALHTTAYSRRGTFCPGTVLNK